jgi:hypothetical protein
MGFGSGMCCIRFLYVLSSITILREGCAESGSLDDDTADYF